MICEKHPKLDDLKTIPLILALKRPDCYIDDAILGFDWVKH
jgi:hypothetical protein